MSGFDGLPDTRHSLRGLTGEGDEAWLIRDIARKLYRCPGCHAAIEIGTEHVVVHYVRRVGGSDHPPLAPALCRGPSDPRAARDPARARRGVRPRPTRAAGAPPRGPAPLRRGGVHPLVCVTKRLGWYVTIARYRRHMTSVRRRDRSAPGPPRRGEPRGRPRGRDEPVPARAPRRRPGDRRRARPRAHHDLPLVRVPRGADRRRARERHQAAARRGARRRAQERAAPRSSTPSTASTAASSTLPPSAVSSSRSATRRVRIITSGAGNVQPRQTWR